jgi:hypothetical protein
MHGSLSRRALRVCAQVQVLDYKERGGGAKDLVQAVVFVEQESQKGIILGKGASALKAMATAARVDIEGFVGAPRCLESCPENRDVHAVNVPGQARRASCFHGSCMALQCYPCQVACRHKHETASGVRERFCACCAQDGPSSWSSR